MRTERTKALCIVPTALVTGGRATSLPEPEKAREDRESTVSEWLDNRAPTSPVSGTHPPVEERLDRLQELARELEGDR